jgi:hypothetical protein
LDPLYSLPEALIDIIAGKQSGSLTERQGVAPGFLSEDEVAFERDLARTVGGGGFFYREPFPCLLLAAPASPEVDRADQEIQSLLGEGLETEGVHPRRVQMIFDNEGRYRELADTRAAAYAGWLVTDARFRQERDALRGAWGTYVEEERRFPVVPQSVLGHPIGPPSRGGKQFAHFMRFYRRWGLETFLTWDLPLPMRPAFHGAPFRQKAGLSEAGVNLFLPWYVLRDGRFGLRELARHLQDLQNPEHLAGWLETVTTRKGELADTRLRNVLILYRYQHLALQSRYSGRPGWDATRQDVAFAEFLNRSEESVRQVRLHLQRRLSGTPPHPPR